MNMVNESLLGLCVQFEIDIPDGYSLDVAARNNFYHWCSNITDKNFPGSILVAGRYNARIYTIDLTLASAKRTGLSYQALLQEGAKRGLLPGGARGAVFVGERHRAVLPAGCILSPEVQALQWTDRQGHRRFPRIWSRATSDQLDLNLDYAHRRDIQSGTNVLFFKPI